MTPKEKAKELFDKHFWNSNTTIQRYYAKQSAIVTVDEIIQLHKGKFMCEREDQNESYWQEVKQELEKL